MQIELNGRRALVTGGSGAIGRQICEQLARSGAAVHMNCAEADRATAEALCEDWRRQSLPVELCVFDVASFEDCQQALLKLSETAGPIDILINCAGITRDAPLRKMEPHAWDAVLRVNLDSVYNTTRQLIESMSERGWGRVVNIASVNGQKGQFGQTNYSAAKAGMHGFSMALAQEVARKGVTVNTVSPGYIDTPMIQAVPQPIRDRILESIPAGRFGRPREIADAVVFLCSQQAAFITGTNLSVNGGQFMSA